MHVDLSLLARAFALALVMEGMLWLALPHSMRRATLHVARMPDDQLRLFSGVLIVLGLLILLAARA